MRKNCINTNNRSVTFQRLVGIPTHRKSIFLDFVDLHKLRLITRIFGAKDTKFCNYNYNGQNYNFFFFK